MQNWPSAIEVVANMLNDQGIPCVATKGNPLPKPWKKWYLHPVGELETVAVRIDHVKHDVDVGHRLIFCQVSAYSSDAASIASSGEAYL